MKTNKDILKNEEERKERNRSSYSELPDEDESLPEKINKKEQNKNNKEIKEGKGLRRSKTHKEKNDPDRFKGDGVNFKAKIIGIESVDDARGNKMCQEALQKLKAAVKISGEHKQRIILNISLCGIRIKDEKSGEPLHHHPVHKISFISQDTGDNRAFGYVFGCPQSGHQFFGIKTEKTASQVVITLRDLFQVALELKKKEIEKAIELQKDTQDASDQYKEPNVESEPVTPDNITPDQIENITPDETENKTTPDEEKPEIPEEPVYCDVLSIHEVEEIKKAEETILPDPPTESQSAADNLLDLQFEMDTLQQGITQMDNSIASAASLGFGVSFSEDDNSVSSGNSFVMTPRKFDRISSLYHETLSISSRSSSTSEYNIYSQETKCEDFDTAPKNIEAPTNNPTPPPQNPSVSTVNNIDDKYAVFQDIDSLPSVFDNPNIVPISESNEDTEEVGVLPGLNGMKDDISAVENDDKMEQAGKPVDSAVFAELDPLGDHPYVDKENFFYEIKNPPKKVLKDLIGDGTGKNSSFSESDSVACCMQVNGFGETVTMNGDTLSNPFALSKETASLPTSPPKLPPKRSFSVTSPLPFTPSLKNDLPITNEDTAFDFKNPFNPFINGAEIPDVPPPNSPPPPPPPRLPVKGCEPVYVTSPPPRPPSRTCGTPTPPLPRRKPPLSSSGRAWYSFDHDVSSSWPSVQHQPNQEAYISSSSPPIPVPSRKLPAVNKCDSPMHKSSSATSSPAISRRFLNYGPCSSNPTLSKEISENGKQQNIGTPNRKILSRHGSVAQDSWNEKLSNDISPQINAVKNPFTESSPSHAIGAKHQADSILNLTRSPPLPPKSISRPRPSPSKKMLAVTSVSLSSSNSSVAEGTNDSHSTSSLHFGSFEESKNDSATDILYGNSTDSQSDDIFSNGHNDEVSMQSATAENGHEENATSLSPTSPDSIFRRKSDPFADDFFLSLPKKPTNVNGSLAITSITGETQCTNGFQMDCEESKDPLYSHVNKSKKEVS